MTGGVAPFTFAVSAGTLPDGLTLDTATGLISQDADDGPAQTDFTIEATDADGVTADQAYTLIVNATLAIDQATLARRPRSASPTRSS